jgi:pilus assembly protein CpaB
VRTRLLTITLAAVLALLGVVAILAYVRHANERAVNGLKAETVLVAAQAIPATTSLDQAQQQGWLTTEQVPVSSLNNPGNPPVHSVTASNGHEVVSAGVTKGQVLLTNMLASSPAAITQGGGASLSLPQGDIAVTMEMCLDADVAGYVQPGSYIAVFDTYAIGGVMQYTCTSHQAPQGGKVGVAAVVPSVLVLSITPASQGTSSTSGQLAADGPSNDPAASVNSSGEVFVTLAATTQAEAENLILMTTAGDPTYGLLNKAGVPAITPDGPFSGN